MRKPLQRILLAEDEPDIREVATMALEAVGGFTVTTCVNGREAVAAVAGVNPDLIILDVMMPVLDGPGALAEIRRIPGMATTPVVFMTAKVQPAEVEEYKAMGAVAVLPKPFDPMTLSDQLQEIWAGLAA